MARTKQVALKSYAGKQIARKVARKKSKAGTSIPIKKEPVQPVKFPVPGPASRATKARAKRK